ncbi:MAG: hypothetical protein HKN17_03780 [Rhodothermales bacterium]|nr:hypothetical protein [Rhodothermales bacterium]
MLLKILTIAVIAWFVLRAARNLIQAVASDRGIPESHTDPRSGPDDAADVEDARFRDI